MLNREKMEVKNMTFSYNLLVFAGKMALKVYIYVKFDNKSIGRSKLFKNFEKLPKNAFIVNKIYYVFKTIAFFLTLIVSNRI